MKTNEEIRQWLREQTTFQPDNIVLFEEEDFANAFVGLTYDDRAVYDWNLMIQYLVDNRQMSEDEAIEYLEVNTLRALCCVEYSPIVVSFCKNN